MNTATRVLICLVALVISGCVILPSRIGEKHPYREDVTSFVVPGTTAKADVVAKLGDQYFKSSDGYWMVFPAGRRMTEWFWLFCTQGGCDGGDFGGDTRWYYLIVEFGNDDTVSDFLIVTGKKPCAERRHVCFDDGDLTVMAAGGQTTIDLNPPRTPRDYLYLTEVTVRDGKVFETGMTEPFTGRVSVLDGRGISQWVRNYEDGELSGAEMKWHKSGQVSYLAHHSKNLQHGPAISWESDGTVISETCYQNGSVVDVPINECHP